MLGGWVSLLFLLLWKLVCLVSNDFSAYFSLCLETSTLCRWIIFRRKPTEWRHKGEKKKHIKKIQPLKKKSALLRAKELPGCCAIGINHHGARPLGSLPQGGAHRGFTMCGKYFEVNWVLSAGGNVISKEDSSYSILCHYQFHFLKFTPSHLLPLLPLPNNNKKKKRKKEKENISNIFEGSIALK